MNANLEIRLANGKEAFNHVLHSLVDCALVENTSKSLKHCCSGGKGTQRLNCGDIKPAQDDKVAKQCGRTLAALGRKLSQCLTALLDKRDCHFYRIVSGFLQKKHEQLQRDDFVCNLLIHQMRKKFDTRQCQYLQEECRATEREIKM